MEKNISKSKIIMIAILILIFFFAMWLYNYRNKEDKGNVTYVDNEKYLLLNDYSRFFTVNSCIYKYINYLQKEDFDSLFQVLDEDYVSRVGLNKNNIYNYLPNLSGGVYNYSSKKIYYQEDSKDYISYYVFGYIIKDVMDSVGEKQPYLYIVNLDTNNKTFSISPYYGDLFKEDMNG